MLCIDSAPNAQLATELAEQGGGVARFLTSQPEEEDITTALDEVLADWAEPVHTGLRLVVDRPDVEVAVRDTTPSAQAGSSDIDLGDLPAGRTLWVVGRVPRGEAGSLNFRLASAKQVNVASVRAELGQENSAGSAFKSLFGARRVQGLEYLVHADHDARELPRRLQRLGYDPAVLEQQGSKVYAENRRKDAAAGLRDLLVRESLAYGLASSEVGFAAVRSEEGKPVDGTVIVANALPHGWSEGFATSLPGVMFACSLPMGAAPAAEYAPLQMGGRAKLRKSGAGGLRAMKMAPSQERSTRRTVVFRGVPAFADTEAVLFDSTQEPDKLESGATISRLELAYPAGHPASDTVDAELALLIFVEDLAIPRARVCVLDLLRQRGVRPLNLLRRTGQQIRIVLVDPNHAWQKQGPLIEVALG